MGRLKSRMDRLCAGIFGERYLSDAAFRSEAALYGGLSVNLLYIAVNLVSGIWHRSVWFVALAVYYLLLSAARFILLRYVSRAPAGRDLRAEYRRSLACGFLLLLMNQSLIGILILVMRQERSYYYPGHLIYAMAAYAFYSLTAAIVNAVKIRRLGSPVLSAARAVGLTAAIVSMLALETAMFARFGGGSPGFQRIMLSATGGAVFLIVLVMGLRMVIRACLRLRQLR